MLTPSQTSPQGRSYSSFLNSPVAHLKRIGSSMTKTYGHNTSKQKMTQLTETFTLWGEYTLFVHKKGNPWYEHRINQHSLHTMGSDAFCVGHVILGVSVLVPTMEVKQTFLHFLGAFVHFSWKLWVCPDVRMFAKQIYDREFFCCQTALSTASLKKSCPTTYPFSL